MISLMYRTLLYPCPDCRVHFKELIAKNPIKNGGRVEFTLYICGLHNQVNEKLGKPTFDCLKSLEYWGGDCGCMKDLQANRTAQENATYKRVYTNNHTHDPLLAKNPFINATINGTEAVTNSVVNTTTSDNSRVNASASEQISKTDKKASTNISASNNTEAVKLTENKLDPPANAIIPDPVVNTISLKNLNNTIVQSAVNTSTLASSHILNKTTGVPGPIKYKTIKRNLKNNNIESATIIMNNTDIKTTIKK